jgi:hypothetical protein
MIRDDGENVWFDEIARMTRIEREAVEAKRRQIEIKARGEQDERFKQVIIIKIAFHGVVDRNPTLHTILPMHITPMLIYTYPQRVSNCYYCVHRLDPFFLGS